MKIVESSPLLTAEQLAGLLQVSERTVWRLRSAGKLPTPMEIGGSIRWHTESVRRWIEDGCPTLPARKKRHGDH